MENITIKDLKSDIQELEFQIECLINGFMANHNDVELLGVNTEIEYVKLKTYKSRVRVDVRVPRI